MDDKALARILAVEVLLCDFTDRPLSCTGRPPSLLLGASRTDLPAWPDMSAVFACNHGTRACGARYALPLLHELLILTVASMPAT
jgi:hypothetical protein